MYWQRSIIRQIENSCHNTSFSVGHDRLFEPQQAILERLAVPILPGRFNNGVCFDMARLMPHRLHQLLLASHRRPVNLDFRRAIWIKNRHAVNVKKVRPLDENVWQFTAERFTVHLLVDRVQVRLTEPLTPQSISGAVEDDGSQGKRDADLDSLAHTLVLT